MEKKTLHIIFEVLGVLLGIFLVLSGLYLIRSADKIAAMFGWAYIVLGLGNVIVDTSFILSFVPDKMWEKVRTYMWVYKQTKLMSKIETKVGTNDFFSK